MQIANELAISTKKKFVVGFIFNPNLKYVALIKKTHPASQAGKFNGIGGGVEPGESPCECMAREALEEANVQSEPKDWTYIGKILPPSNEKIVYFYAMITSNPLSIETMTDEEVGLYPTGFLPENSHNNLHYLVLLAKFELQNPGSQGKFIIEGGTVNDL